MFCKRVHLKAGVSFYYVYYDGTPRDYVALLGLVVEVGEGADDIGAETVKLLVYERKEKRRMAYGIRAPSVSTLAIRRSSPSS